MDFIDPYWPDQWYLVSNYVHTQLKCTFRSSVPSWLSPNDILYVHSSKKETYLFKIHRFFLMTLGQGQWPWVTPNFLNAPGSNLQKTPSKNLKQLSQYTQQSELFQIVALFAWKSMEILPFREFPELTIEYTERTVWDFWTGSFANYSQEHWKCWAWPRVTRKNGWTKGTILFEKSVSKFTLASTYFKLAFNAVLCPDPMNAVILLGWTGPGGLWLIHVIYWPQGDLVNQHQTSSFSLTGARILYTCAVKYKLFNV